MISDSQANLKNCFTTGTETFPIQAATRIIVTFIYITRLVAELFSYVDTEAKFDLLLGSGSFFLPNMACVWLDDRAGTTRG